MGDIKDDTRNLPCVMKIALNMLIYGNVQDAAIYIPKSLGRIKLSQDRLGITALLLALVLTAAKNIASRMATSITKHSHLVEGNIAHYPGPQYPFKQWTSLNAINDAQKNMLHWRSCPEFVFGLGNAVRKRSDMRAPIKEKRVNELEMTPELWRAISTVAIQYSREE
ncbi:hypothetical protein BGX24_007058 [Mortierella sp. AD032]|nr:hypothetical protein BGX24_007058 [Mortierella sp. AD032]